MRGRGSRGRWPACWGQLSTFFPSSPSRPGRGVASSRAWPISCSATRTRCRCPASSTRSQRWSAPQDKDWFAYKKSEPAARRRRRRAAARAARRRLRRGRHLPDQRRASPALAVALRGGRRPRRRGHLHQPALVLLRGADPAAGARAGARPGAARRLRPRPGGHRRGDHAAHARDHRQLAPQPDRRHLPAGDADGAGRAADARLRSATAARSTCSPTRPTAASSSTAAHYPSPTAFYPHTFLIYTYGKTLLTPGQRIGYIALPPTLPAAERELLRTGDRDGADRSPATPSRTRSSSTPCPTWSGCRSTSPSLQRKRDRMVAALREIGYAVHAPAGDLLPAAALAAGRRPGLHRAAGRARRLRPARRRLSSCPATSASR